MFYSNKGVSARGGGGDEKTYYFKHLRVIYALKLQLLFYGNININNAFKCINYAHQHDMTCRTSLVKMN